jgi:hypothetical protein
MLDAIASTGVTTSDLEQELASAIESYKQIKQ